MSIAQLRKWTDTSAPSLTGANYGELDALLQAVLVDGYGSQAALGWTTTYSDTNRKVFQNVSTGSNKFLRVDHSSASGDTKAALVSAYEVVSDVDSGQLRAPTQGFSTRIDIVANTTGTTPWMIIGDDLGFWFVWKPYYAQYGSAGYGQMWYIAYFGDYIPADISNTFNFFVSGCTDTYAYSPIGDADTQSNTNEFTWVLRGYNLEPGAVTVGINPGSAYYYASDPRLGSYANISPFLTTEGSVIDELFYTIPSLHDTNGRLLGWLPGFLNPQVHSGDWEGNTIATYSDYEFVLSDRTFHFLRYRWASAGSSSPYSICLISGEGFRDVP